MKKLLTIIIVALFSIQSISAQAPDLSSFSHLEYYNGAVIFKNVYQAEGTEQELREQLVVHLKLMEGVSIIDVTLSTITVDIMGIRINNETGDKKLNRVLVLSYPIFAKAIIQVRDGRYMVMVKDINSIAWLNQGDNVPPMEVVRPLQWFFDTHIFYGRKTRDRNVLAIKNIETKFYRMFDIRNSIVNEKW